MVTASPIRVICGVPARRFLRYAARMLFLSASSASLWCEPSSFIAWMSSSVNPPTGVPITYGVPNFSWRIFAAGRPTEDTTRFTSASPAWNKFSSVSPIAQVEMTSQPRWRKVCFMASTFACGPKSSGVTPRRLRVCGLIWCGFLTNRSAIFSSARPAP